MRTSLCFLAACAVLVPCFSEDEMASSCASSDDDGDDRCEFIQSGVGVVSQHQGVAADTKNVVSQHQSKAAPAKTVVSQHQGEEAAQIKKEANQKSWPDIFKKLKDIISGSDDLKKDSQNLKEEVEAFATVVAETTTDLSKKVTSAKTLEEVTTEVDAAGHKIWLALKSVLDALAKIGADFDDGIAKALPSTTFKDYFDKVIAHIKTEGDALEAYIDLKLSKFGNTTKMCADAETRIESLKEKVNTFVKSMTGLTPDGIKEEVDEMFKLLPENAQEEINKFLAKITESATSFIDAATKAGKDIYGSFGKALKGHCPNFATFESPAAPSKVGIVTALAVSAAALTL